ncbi:hypothetical protein L4X63_16920 [Geomonas sp. Red32]|uniref:hypothetical protein n=1 Tax=Geomonas sp. Red32 TaxID=2912856 RepID=UPI00202CA894|nr:hypothetical protein [Geomonas sp. Red32]MCM0083270.1 hypothetical protein [Geomonas sp. Red32]
MNTSLDLDSIHSQLRDLATKRAAGIAEYGTEYRLNGTERTFRAILDKDAKGAMFQADAPLQPGQLYESKTGTIIILAAQDFPGCKAATVAEVVGSAQVLQKTATSGPQGAAVILTSTAQTTPILSHSSTKGDEVTVPVRFASIKGRVLKTASGQLLEVTAARIEGQVAHLKCEPYREPETKSLKCEPTPPRWVTDAPQKAPWHSSSSYNGW